MDRQVLAFEVDSLKERAYGASSSAVPYSRRLAQPIALAPRPSLIPSPQFQPVSQILADILHSAAVVLGADQAFVFVDRGERAMETAAILNLRSARLADLALRQAAACIRTALQQRRLSATNDCGTELDGEENFLQASTLCVPLDIGRHQSGVMCVIRRRGARALTRLDLEIVHALAEQAALAVGAARHQCALSRLEACLCEAATEAH
jgi:GAF domain-containing protein